MEALLWLTSVTDKFWENLRPETALLARSFVEHCIDRKDESRLETTLPVMTALAFRLQAAYNSFLRVLQDGNEQYEEDEEDREEQSANVEFVMSELLRLAVHLDYSDEIGRRKMFGVVREYTQNSRKATFKPRLWQEICLHTPSYPKC